jgi:flagellar hook assembly protein FlgD
MVTLRVFDVNGTSVRTLVDGFRATGVYREVWDGTADDGTALSSGVYFYRLEAGDFVATRKMVLLR